jgi:MraZ protein
VAEDFALRGNEPAKIDDKGRLKIPNAFRVLVEERYGPDLFVTSVEGRSVLIYPLPVWVEIERKLASAPSTNTARIWFSRRVNYYGKSASIDNQGRVLIHPLLRESAGMTGVVDVFGHTNYIEVWNHERFVKDLDEHPYTVEAASALAELGI